MKTFLCKTCKQKFEAEGKRIEWNDPIYGPCNKFIATCPCDGGDCDEYRPLKNSKEELAPSVPPCGSGGCCCKR